jgi:hypothetical protein
MQFGVKIARIVKTIVDPKMGGRLSTPPFSPNIISLFFSFPSRAAALDWRRDR